MEDYLQLDEFIDLVGRDAVPAENAIRLINSACRHIDSLTFGRIQKYGFSRLTDFQKRLIKQAIARQAVFEYENADVLNSTMKSYSINGVAVNFGSGLNMKIENGVATTNDIYNLLMRTGLNTLNFYL